MSQRLPDYDAMRLREQQAARTEPDPQSNAKRKGARIFLQSITEFQAAKTKEEQ